MIASVAVLAAILGVVSAPAASQSSGTVDWIDISYQKFVLPNGLTLIVHEDHKAPIIAFNVWYHVGSKNENPGKTGFAHLFEHLMFNGSENYNDDYFKPLQKIGATDLNATTSQDRTNYFETVPTSALDLVLWMESDRMGHLKGAINQAKLDEQRGVVFNEIRQGLNEPFGIPEELIIKGTYPPEHPYSWPVGGSIDDLNNAKLEDVHKWFETYYGPNNAVISLAGDIDPKTALEKITKYFGDIPPSPPITKHKVWIAKRGSVHRETVQDRVSQSRIYKIWNIPQWGSEEGNLLSLAGLILSSGETSRLHKRLVCDDQIATSIMAYAQLNEIGGTFTIMADAKQDVPLEKVEKALDEELVRFITVGPTVQELDRVKATLHANFIRRIERIGGFGGKSDILAMSEVYSGSPDAYKVNLKYADQATVESIKSTAAKWLSDGVYILEVHPYPHLVVQKGGVDRKTMPAVGPAPEANFPSLQRATLSNGLKIVLAERHSIPVVQLRLLIDAGFAADQFGFSGTSMLTMSMLAKGTARRTSFQISEELALLGAKLDAGSNLDVSFVSLVTLKEKIDQALDIYSDVILNPLFPELDFRRQQNLQIADIRREKDSPFKDVFRIFPPLLYGKKHAYSVPFTGTGYEETVANITRDDLIRYHKTWFKADHATLIIVGDVTLAEILPKLEKTFKGWEGGKTPDKNIASVSLPGTQRIYLIDKPEAHQSLVFAGLLSPSSSNPETIAIETMNLILGEDFISRINMKIREEKRWSYGANSKIFEARGQRPFTIMAPVQSDKTKETLLEINKELEGVLGQKPITENEYRNALSARILSLPGRWETMTAVMDSIADIVQYGLPEDIYQKYSSRIRNLSVSDLNRAAKTAIHPESITWIIIGDLAKIEPKIRELGYKDIYVIDEDGDFIR